MNSRYKKLFLLTLALILTFNTVSFGVKPQQKLEKPKEVEEEEIVREKAYLVGDYDSGTILTSKSDLKKPREIASITKIFTYLLVMEEVDKGNLNLDDKVKITHDVTRVRGSSMYLSEDEKLTVKELLDGLLIVSANDAAYALAKYSYGSEEKFVKAMNKKLKDLKLEGKFYNSTGLPTVDRKQNTMTMESLFELTRYILKTQADILKITSKKKLVMNNREFMEDKMFHHRNTNLLLNTMPGVDGLKTGYTDKAGYCLVTTIKSSFCNSDCRMIAIVLGEDSELKRAEKSREVIEEVMDRYKKEDLLDKTKPVKVIESNTVKSGKISVYPKEDLCEIIKKDEHMDMKIKLSPIIAAPFKKGEKVGKAIIYKNQKEYKKVDLIVKEDIRRVIFLERILNYIRDLF